MNKVDYYNISRRNSLSRLAIFIGLAGIILSSSFGSFILTVAIIFIPLIIIFILSFLEYPPILLYTTFILNYLIMGIGRYINLEGISAVMDTILVSQLILIWIHSALKQDIPWKNGLNILTIVTFIWMIYCIIELANPTGMLEAWVLSRGLIFNGLIISLISTLLITRIKQVKIIILLYSILTLLAVGKAIMQKTIGFDSFEQAWLAGGGALTHIIGSGTRYFSFFTDAGNFGSNMGCAGVVFGIIAFITPQKVSKIYYAIISLLSIYAMFLSGTRGAMIVPLGGLALYIIISKNYKAIFIGGFLLVFIYIFFAYTYIGQNNPQIRRMRTSFRPTEDASFNVRRENQKRLAEYLKYKPIGEGLGLSGVENKKVSIRFTTNIPHDSWYVKIWVETGIIGLILYLGGLLIVIFKCMWIIMFKIKSKELKGIYSGLLCGIFGMMLSAYGNAFWGQYPTMIIAFVGLSMILNGEYVEQQINNKNLIIKI